MRINKLIWIALTGLFQTQCTGGNMSPSEYRTFLESQPKGLYLERSFGDLQYSMQFLPVEWMALREWLRQASLDQNGWQSILNKYRGSRYFLLRIVSSHSNNLLRYRLSSIEEYQRRVQYCSFGIRDDLLLMQREQTWNCSGVFMLYIISFSFLRIFSVLEETRLYWMILCVVSLILFSIHLYVHGKEIDHKSS